jgi:phage terminase large subunit
MTKQQKIELYKRLVLENRKRMPIAIRKALEDKIRYVFLHGGRGGAKSESVAKWILAKANKKKLRVLCTREIQVSIKDSVYMLLKDLIGQLMYTDYKCTDNSIVNTKTGSEFLFLGMWQQEKKQTLKSLANIDICWIEEAQTISKGSLDLLDPTIRKSGSRIIATFNRFLPIDPIWSFKELIEPEDKADVQINYDGNPYLPDTLRKQAERSKKAFEEGFSEDYLHIWLGNPVGLSEKALITLREVEESVNREATEEGQIEVGVDVARFGKDKTVLIKRKGLIMLDCQAYSKTSVIDTFKLVVDYVGNNTSIPIKVDDTGVGGGVTDMLNEYGFNAIPVNNGESANEKDKYMNKGSEIWFDFKKKLKQIKLMDIPELKNELVTREWKIDMKGRRAIESKEDYKKRGYHSPDLADACMLAFYTEEACGPVFLRSIM